MRPDAEVGRLLDAEVRARGKKLPRFAKKVGLPDRTLRSYATGEYPIPPEVARELIVALDYEPFVIPALREALVIRGNHQDAEEARNLIEPVELRVDTVILTVEVAEKRRDVLADCIHAQLPEQPMGDNRLRSYREAGHAKIGEAHFTAHWSPWRNKSRWLRIQLAPWEPAHCRLVQKILRCACVRSPTGLLS